jgi:hypothetical protein
MRARSPESEGQDATRKRAQGKSGPRLAVFVWHVRERLLVYVVRVSPNTYTTIVLQEGRECFVDLVLPHCQRPPWSRFTPALRSDAKDRGLATNPRLRIGATAFCSDSLIELQLVCELNHGLRLSWGKGPIAGPSVGVRQRFALWPSSWLFCRW